MTVLSRSKYYAAPVANPSSDRDGWSCAQGWYGRCTPKNR